MRQKDKELLLKDLCARLPYGALVFIRKPFGCVMSETEEEELTATTLQEFIENDDMHVFPYLRPMSSMTEEEWLTLKEWIFIASDTEGKIYFDGFRNISAEDTTKAIDYLISHYFDYRGLIPMGIALEAKEGMYND